MRYRVIKWEDGYKVERGTNYMGLSLLPIRFDMTKETFTTIDEAKNHIVKLKQERGDYETVFDTK